MWKLAILFVVAVGATAAWAAPAAATTADVQAYFVNQELKFSEAGFSAKEDDNGFGVRGRLFVTDSLFVTGRFQRVGFSFEDEFGTESFDIDDRRIGLGWSQSLSPAATFFIKAEYVDLGSDVDESGYGVTGGIDLWLSPEFSLRGELGYLDLDELDGVEYTIGGTYMFTPQVGAFAEWRRWDASFDGVSVDLTDIRLGVTLRF